LGWVVDDYTVLIICESILVLLFLLDKWGKGIILREIIALHAVLVLLLMPLIGYKFYTIDNPLAELWVKYMPIGELVYFQFVFPAVLVFILVLCWPISAIKAIDDGELFVRKMELSLHKLQSSRINPILLVLGGSVMYFIQPYLPAILQYVGYLFYTASFAGFLMLYLNSKAKYRKLFMGYFIVFVLYVSITSTMFTIVVYMGMTMSSFLYLNLNVSLWKKITFFLLISGLIVALQSVKGIYRSSPDASTGSQNRGLYLGKLLTQEISRGYRGYSSDRFFPIYYRANQGFLVAQVIKYIPEKKQFDNGAYLSLALFSSLIPRLFWPDKPMAGGRFTTKYFTGEELVGNTSMNVSPVGEAYGSFGPIFGVVYMGLLAFLIRIVYTTFLSLANTIPLLIYWFPVIFFQVTYSMETDSLQIFNSLFKSGVFVFILYLLSPTSFGVEKKSFLALK
jgi:hypothetical protein